MLSWSQITIWYVAGNLVLMFFYTVLTAIGGAFDLVYLLSKLKDKKPDELDNGRVIHNVQ